MSRHFVRLAGAMAMAAGGLLTAPAAARAEDLTIVSNVTVGKGAPVTSTQYLSGHKVRTSDGERDTIIEAGGRTVMIDQKKREYWESSTSEMAQFMTDMEAQLKNPVMEKMLGAMADVQVEKGAGTRQIAGYDTQEYVLTMGDTLRFNVWVAPALPVPQQYIDARKAAAAAMGPMGRRFEKMYEEMGKMRGFPLALGISSKATMFKQETVSEAVEVKKGPIPASAFEVPAGYRKKDSPFARRRK